MRVFEGDSTKTFTDINLSTVIIFIRFNVIIWFCRLFLIKVPAFQRGGSIIPYKFRLRRSSTQMADDPFTLVIALDKEKSASGQLYFDDAISFNYKKNKEFVHRQFNIKNNILSST